MGQCILAFVGECRQNLNVMQYPARAAMHSHLPSEAGFRAFTTHAGPPYWVLPQGFQSLPSGTALAIFAGSLHEKYKFILRRIQFFPAEPYI
ncbi:UNVERIFIED_CONTAM: hypothetical protein Sradi_7159000 [Sesamum radiatum]|uniref:Uncharacterized protein n=1 Tax=Sesamum radiatum TaxID=300843 RepID=A0AAW2IV59_SESRA